MLQAALLSLAVAVRAVMLLGAAASALAQPAPLVGADQALGAGWRVVGLPQQSMPFTRYTAASIDGRPAVRLEATASYGNLVFLSGIGYHKEGDIKIHTAAVLDELQKKLEAAGSSMEKVLKVNVYLNDLKDYAGMNEVFLGRFGPEPGVRTTIAAAGGIPGNSLVEIDCIACL